MAERELFARFKPKWWDSVSARAWARTFVGLQIDVQPIMFALALFGVSMVLTVASTSLAEAVISAKAAALNGLGWVFLFFCWYLWNVWGAAHEIHAEQQRQIEDLEVALASRSREATVNAPASPSPPTGHLTFEGQAPVVQVAPVIRPLSDRLIQLRIDGVKLRNEKVSVEAFKEWRSRVEQWKADVLHAIAGKANLADVARFTVLDRVPVMDFKWSTSKGQTRHLRELSRRIEILLEIMAKIGEPDTSKP